MKCLEVKYPNPKCLWTKQCLKGRQTRPKEIVILYVSFLFYNFAKLSSCRIFSFYASFTLLQNYTRMKSLPKKSPRIQESTFKRRNFCPLTSKRGFGPSYCKVKVPWEKRWVLFKMSFIPLGIIDFKSRKMYGLRAILFGKSKSIKLRNF